MKKSTKTLLAEQHRNTRHDAIDQLQDIRNCFIEVHTIPENIWDSLINRIMNLKQRLPEGVPAFDDICPHCRRYNFDNVYDTVKQRGICREKCGAGHFTWIDAEDRKSLEHCNDFRE